MCFKVKDNSRQAAFDIDVADTNEKQETTRESAAGQNVEDTNEKGSEQSTNTETQIQKVSLFKDGAQGDCNTDEETSVHKREDGDHDDDDDGGGGGGSGGVSSDAETDAEHRGEVMGKAQPLLSETEKEKGEVEYGTGDIKETVSCDEQAAPAGVQPTTEHDDADTRPGPHRGPTEQDNAASLEPRFDATDIDSESGHPSELKESDAVKTQSQVKYEKRKADTEIQEDVSHSKKQRVGLEKKVDYSEMETGTVTDPTNVDLAEDSDKPSAAETEMEQQSKLEEEKPENLGIPMELETQTVYPYSKAAVVKLQTAEDNVKPASECIESEQSRIIHSLPGYTKYLAAVERVKERLSNSTEQPKDNSLLNSLRFYTREEHLDEYYCLECNKGRISFYLITVCVLAFSFNSCTWYCLPCDMV